MNHEEWKSLTGHEATDEEWEIIQSVYNFHPSIPDIGGKKKMAVVYKLGGMGLIRDMLQTANEVHEIESRVHISRNELETAQMVYNEQVELLGAYRKKYMVKQDD